MTSTVCSSWLGNVIGNFQKGRLNHFLKNPSWGKMDKCRISPHVFLLLLSYSGRGIRREWTVNISLASSTSFSVPSTAFEQCGLGNTFLCNESMQCMGLSRVTEMRHVMRHIIGTGASCDAVSTLMRTLDILITASSINIDWRSSQVAPDLVFCNLDNDCGPDSFHLFIFISTT